jgi:hypothetical protein
MESSIRCLTAADRDADVVFSSTRTVPYACIGLLLSLLSVITVVTSFALPRVVGDDRTRCA